MLLLEGAMCQGRGLPVAVEPDSWLTASKNWGFRSFNHKYLSSAKNLKELGSRFYFRVHSLSNTLIPACETLGRKPTQVHLDF